MHSATLEKPATIPGSYTVLKNAQLVLEHEVVRGSVALRDGLIASVDPGGTAVRGAIDCEGCYLCPGLVELHTDNLERHMVPRPGVAWPRRAAVLAHDAELASAGITTVFDALRVGSIVSDARSRYGRYAREVSRDILALTTEGALRISHYVHLRAEICSETLAEELEEFGPEDRVRIVSLMDHTPGQRQFADITQLRTYLSGKYAMSEREMDEHFELQKQVTARYGDVHTQVVIERAAALGATLASHDDTTAEHVTESLRAGVTLAEFPTTLEAAETSRDCGIAVMMGAPNIVRGGSHSGNVSAAELSGRGLLDILSSDYIPASLLMAAVQLGEAQGNLPAGLALVTSEPARAAKLWDRGRIAPGLCGDLVCFAVHGGIPVTRGVWVAGDRVA